MKYVLAALLLVLALPFVAAETVTDYYVQPSNVICSDSTLDGNWAENVCSGTYTTSNDACENALVSCDDANAETFSASRENLMGVDARVADPSVDPQSQCDEILGVRVAYRYSADADVDERTFEVSNDDGASWQEACGGVPDEAGVTHTCDVSTTVTWTCEDFFGENTQARTRLTAMRGGGNPQLTYESTFNYLVFFVDYNFSSNPLETDSTSYVQGADVNITGEDVWGAAENITINVTLGGDLLDQLSTTTDAQGSFDVLYALSDYAPTGLYELVAVQDSDQGTRAEANFTVNQREPTVQTQRPGSFYNRSETATLLGEGFASEVEVFIEVLSPEGEALLQTNTTTTSEGELSFNYSFSDSFSASSGEYTFMFTEEPDASYQAQTSAQLVTLLETATRSTDGANVLEEMYVLDGDFARFTATSGQEDYFELTFFDVFPQEADIDELFFELFHRESSIDADVYIKWFNPASTAWETIPGCVFTANISSRWNSCDLTSVVSDAQQANDLQLRISDDDQVGGNDDWNYDVDIALVRGSFSLEPGITNLQVSDVTTRSAVVSWQTQKSANATVRYGVTTSYGEVLVNETFSTEHEFFLQDLDADTTYYVEVTSCTEYACETQGPIEFTTEEETAPTITDFEVSIGDAEVNFSWRTDRETSSSLSYGTSESYSSTLTNEMESETHFFTISDLAPATTYYYEAESCDELGCARETGSFKTPPPTQGCAYTYTETAPDHEPGLIKKGDVVVFDCRLQEPIGAREELRVQLSWPSELLNKLVSTPRLLYREPEVLYP